MPIEIDEEVDIRHFTENPRFEKIPYLIEFRADWCGPCKTLEPVMDEIEVDYFQQIHVLSVDVDNNRKITERYSVRNIPTTILCNDKGEEVERIVGAVPKKDITDKIDLLLNIEKPTLPLFEMVSGRVLTTVRRFRVYLEIPHRTTGYWSLEDGDILEEIFNKPNQFCNITKLEKYGGKRTAPIHASLKNYNNIIKEAADSQHAKITNVYKTAESLKEIESIDVKESVVFQKFTKKAVALYKKNRKKLAEANEDLTILRNILEIEDED